MVPGFTPTTIAAVRTPATATSALTIHELERPRLVFIGKVPSKFDGTSVLKRQAGCSCSSLYGQAWGRRGASDDGPRVTAHYKSGDLTDHRSNCLKRGEVNLTYGFADHAFGVANPVTDLIRSVFKCGKRIGQTDWIAFSTWIAES